MGHVPPFRDMKKMRDERVSKKQLQSDDGGQHGRKGLENEAGRQPWKSWASRWPGPGGLLIGPADNGTPTAGSSQVCLSSWVRPQEGT